MTSKSTSSSILYSKLKNVPYCIIAKIHWYKTLCSWWEGNKKLIFKLITINYCYSTLQIQNFKLHFLFLNCPQYSRFLKLRQLFQRGGEEVADVKGFPFLFRCPHTSGHQPGCIWKNINKKWKRRLLSTIRRTKSADVEDYVSKTHTPPHHRAARMKGKHASVTDWSPPAPLCLCSTLPWGNSTLWRLGLIPRKQNHDLERMASAKEQPHWLCWFRK